MTRPLRPLGWSVPAEELSDYFPPSVPDLGHEALDRLRGTGAEVSSAAGDRAEASRDFWTLAQRWALHGVAPARPAVVVRPETAEQVAAVLSLANGESIPVTPAGGRSGVSGGAVPLGGGIALDCRRLAGIIEVDADSGLVEVGAGTLLCELEERLRREHGLTLGHWPQSVELATVGGSVASRGAGQYSTRYGKIEDLVAGLEVVLADGRLLRTGAAAGAGPRAATGPDLTQLFVGSEGTLGVITSVVLRTRPLPASERRASYSFTHFADGLEAIRLTLRAGATPAVLRLYDESESGRHFSRNGNILLALDEGDGRVVATAMAVLEATCLSLGATSCGEGPVEEWHARRNDASSLAGLLESGIVLDTIELASRWSALESLRNDVIASLRGVDGSIAASCHASHAYLDGACLYFTFAGRGPDPNDDVWAERFYAASWSAAVDALERHGGSLSHHHGVGIVRTPFLARALGEGAAVVEQLKRALDPHGILNPGKLGDPAPVWLRTVGRSAPG